MACIIATSGKRPDLASPGRTAATDPRLPTRSFLRHSVRRRHPPFLGGGADSLRLPTVPASDPLPPISWRGALVTRAWVVVKRVGCGFGEGQQTLQQNPALGTVGLLRATLQAPFQLRTDQTERARALLKLLRLRDVRRTDPLPWLSSQDHHRIPAAAAGAQRMGLRCRQPRGPPSRPQATTPAAVSAPPVARASTGGGQR